MGSKYLIINADDFGICNSVNSAIFKLLKEKKISSATVMPNVNYYEEAVEWTVKNSDNIGLHLIVNLSIEVYQEVNLLKINMDIYWGIE